LPAGEGLGTLDRMSSRSPSQPVTGALRAIAVIAGVAITVAAPAPRGEEARAEVVAPQHRPHPPLAYLPAPPAVGEMPAVSAIVDGAVAARRLPGAVVQVGHGGEVVFRRAYGARKLAGEPGLDGLPTAAEPMTTDTVFDVASLTKVLATSTAVMQLDEKGLIGLDDPVQAHLPEFNPAGDPLRARVTLRMLLTHTSGEPGDVNLDDAWGLARSDPAEGTRRALTAPLESPPGAGFRYSDINYLLLGEVIERMSGETLDGYVQRHVFGPLGMTQSRYLVAGGPLWHNPRLLARIAPTRHDTENARDPVRNPHFGELLRGSVDDPTSRRMGGVAGHAGVFSTAHDVGLFAQALLDRLAGRASSFPLSQATLRLMTAPAQPGASPRQLAEAQRADHETVWGAGHSPGHPGTPHYPAVRGQNLRGLGWDIDTGYSLPRGAVFPVGSFGHTGFTGTSLWIDPASDTYVVVLANVVHAPWGPPISRLAGAVATATAQALGLDRGGPVTG